MSLHFDESKQYEIRLLQDTPDGKKDVVLYVPGLKARELINKGLATPVFRKRDNTPDVMETR